MTGLVTHCREWVTGVNGNEPRHYRHRPRNSPRATSRAPPGYAARAHARRGSFAQRLGMRRLTDHHPAPVFAALVLCGFLLVSAATVGLGFLLVDGILSIGAIAHADEHVNTWLAAHRTSVTDRGFERWLGDRQRLRDPRRGRGRGRLVRRFDATGGPRRSYWRRSLSRSRATG